jgi:hypothetical protein
VANNLIAPLMEDYAAKALAALTVKPGRVISITPGVQPAWDDCCDGQLYVRLNSVEPNVGNARQTIAPCGVLSWTVTLGLGIIRCAHTVNDQGKAPAPAQITSDGFDMTRDLAELQEVILCHEDTRSILMWTPQGVDGGCHGGEWLFTSRVSVCACSDAGDC